METIEVRRLDIISGKQSFVKLIVDGKDLLEEFELSLEERYRTEMRTIYAWMQMVADLNPVPGTVYHPISDGKDGFREYEFKSKHLRVYAIAEPGGKIVVMGGKKNTQRQDIKRFRELKKQLTKYLQRDEAD